jgi:copper resistance protein C
MTCDFSRIRHAVLALGLVLNSAPIVFAHAVLVKSTPNANETVLGPNVPLSLTFNSRIDQSRSTISLENPDHTISKVTIDLDPSAPQKLVGRLSSLAPGSYRLHWQVLAVDGHITRGVISFQVK